MIPVFCCNGGFVGDCTDGDINVLDVRGVGDINVVVAWEFNDVAVRDLATGTIIVVVAGGMGDIVGGWLEACKNSFTLSWSPKVSINRCLATLNEFRGRESKLSH